MPLIRKSGNVPREAPAPHDVLKALNSGNVDERWEAARAAAQVAGGLEAVASALRTENDLRVREAMFTTVATIASPRSVDVLIPLLRLDDASLRIGALDALRAMPAIVRNYLPSLLADADSDVRILSCEIARALPADDATTLLCDLLARESDVNVCAAAIDVLAEVGNTRALPALDECAARFRDSPFLAFAIKVVRDRLLSQPAASHV